jgi:hypothetical protein
MSLCARRILLLTFLSVSRANAQQTDENKFLDLAEIKVSKSLDDFFVGFFTPIVPHSGHNFRTCAGITRLVNEDDVRDPEFEISCTPTQDPLTLLSASDFYEQAIGQSVSNLDGEVIGTVGAVVVDQNGIPNSYVISSTLGLPYALAAADDVSAWSRGAELSFLVNEPPVAVSSIVSLDGNWISPEVIESISRVTNSFEPVFDLGSAYNSGDIGPFGPVGVVAAETWLNFN